MSIQKRFIQFHETIKMRRFGRNRQLREKRDIILKKLREGLPRDRTFTSFNQGSYEMGTGIKPLDGDYDIDLGIEFNVSKSEYTAHAVKGWVYKALEGHTTDVRWREPCITVGYQKQGERAFHVDLAIYAQGSWGRLYLARGRQHSRVENRVWELADPKGLIKLLGGRFSGEDGAQFRRSVRYLKRWRDHNFPSEGNAAPVGIGLTVAAYHWFLPSKHWFTSEYNDLSALSSFVGTLRGRFNQTYKNGRSYRRLHVVVPVQPGNDIFNKMTDEQMEQFYNRLGALQEALGRAAVQTELEAAQTLSGIFGADFPAT
jgi:hypothetical protein